MKKYLYGAIVVFLLVLIVSDITLIVTDEKQVFSWRLQWMEKPLIQMGDWHE